MLFAYDAAVKNLKVEYLGACGADRVLAVGGLLFPGSARVMQQAG